jgi:hypothetical protein
MIEHAMNRQWGDILHNIDILFVYSNYQRSAIRIIHGLEVDLLIDQKFDNRAMTFEMNWRRIEEVNRHTITRCHMKSSFTIHIAGVANVVFIRTILN